MRRQQFTGRKADVIGGLMLNGLTLRQQQQQQQQQP